ncbi:MAG: transcription termination factor NusA [Planctomyces sp.]|nr:transcription termination factor NusA [Planctomyces sp.]
MNGREILRIVDAIHRDKGINPDIVFEGIEQAILSAARKHYGEGSDLIVTIDRVTGDPTMTIDSDEVEPDVMGDLLGRIAAQTAKQVMIQKIREAERDALFDEYMEMKWQLVTGTVSRVDGGRSVTVNLGKVEGILPRSEQIPGEEHRNGERIRAVILEVRKVGSRVRIVLSRSHREMVRRLFEVEIPEIADNVIEVRSLAREAGYRSKVAVSCFDTKVDAVGACVGMRGARIRSIVDELHGERIDIVRWNDSLQVLVPNALQPADVQDVILCPMLGKVIVLVHDDQLSLAIGKKGQNVRLASKLVGWDIQVMTQDMLDQQLDESVTGFVQAPHVNEELAENLVAQGFFTFDDLSIIEPDQLAEMGGLTEEQCDEIIDYADEESERLANMDSGSAAYRASTPQRQTASEPEVKDETADASEPVLPTEESDIPTSPEEDAIHAIGETAETVEQQEESTEPVIESSNDIVPGSNPAAASASAEDNVPEEDIDQPETVEADPVAELEDATPPEDSETREA